MATQGCCPCLVFPQLFPDQFGCVPPGFPASASLANVGTGWPDRQASSSGTIITKSVHNQTIVLVRICNLLYKYKWQLWPAKHCHGRDNMTFKKRSTEGEKINKESRLKNTCIRRLQTTQIQFYICLGPDLLHTGSSGQTQLVLKEEKRANKPWITPLVPSSVWPTVVLQHYQPQNHAQGRSESASHRSPHRPPDPLPTPPRMMRRTPSAAACLCAAGTVAAVLLAVAPAERAVWHMAVTKHPAQGCPPWATGLWSGLGRWDESLPNFGAVLV